MRFVRCLNFKAIVVCAKKLVRVFKSIAERYFPSSNAEI